MARLGRGRPNQRFIRRVNRVNTYYVSAVGSDSNDGLSTATPWATVSKVNAATFNPGDTVLFRGGDTFSGTMLWITSTRSGTASNPVTYGSYGTGRATLNNTTGNAIYVDSVGGVTIQDLILTGGGSNYSDGLNCYKSTSGRASGITITNISATGFYNGISVGGASGGGFDTVTITGSTLYSNMANGLLTYGPDWTGPTYAHSNVTVIGCAAYNNLGDPSQTTKPTGSGLTIGGVDGGLVDQCTAYGNGASSVASSGPVGIWTYNSNNVTIQRSVSYSNRSGQSDGDGFDIDINASNCTIQYCLSYDNDGAGILLYASASTTAWTGNTVRYNLCWGNVRNSRFPYYGEILVAGNAANTAIYSNTLVAKDNTASAMPQPLTLRGTGLSGITVRNNIFYQLGTGSVVLSDSAVASTAALLQGNAYYRPAGLQISWNGVTYSTLAAWRAAVAGQEVVSGSNTGFVGDPLLVNPSVSPTVTDPTLLAQVTSLQLQATSLVAGAGLDLPTLFGTALGGRDYFGNALTVPYAIGAHEAIPALQSTPADSAALTDSVVADLARPLAATGSDTATGSDVVSIGFAPSPADNAAGSDAVSFVANYGPLPADTAALSDAASQVQTQFTSAADTAAGSDSAGIGFGPDTFTEFAAIQATVQADWGQSSSTGSLVAAGTPTTVGTTWASATNANGAADGTLATLTATATGSILLAGYNAQTTIGAQPSSITGVNVTVTYKVATTTRWSAPTVQLYSGTTAIGSAITLPAATTTLTSNTVSFTTTNLPTWAQLSDLRVQVTAVKNGVTSDVFSLDAATAVISYINVVSPLQFNAYNPPVPTESVLATEAVDQLRTVFNTNADTAGGTDTLTPVQDTVRQSADTAQGTDAATAIRGLPLVSLADTAAGSDAAATVTGIQRAPADTAQGTDTCSYVLNTVRVAADTAALTDPITALKQTLAGPDTAKLTDSISVVQKIVRNPTETVAGSDTHTEGGTATYVLGSTAVVETTSHIGVREVHKLKATISIAADVQGAPVRGPQRMPVDLIATGDLKHMRALAATVSVDTSFQRAKFRIVRSMRDTTRMPPEDRLPARSVHSLTNIPEPELAPLTIDDEEFLALETVAVEPVRYGRTFAVLRS